LILQPHRPTVEMKVGALVPMDTPALKEPQDQPVMLQVNVQLANEADSKNEITIRRTQTSGEASKYPGRVWLREASAEAAGPSAQCHPSPAVHAASQTPTLPGS